MRFWNKHSDMIIYDQKHIKQQIFQQKELLVSFSTVVTFTKIHGHDFRIAEEHQYL